MVLNKPLAYSQPRRLRSMTHFAVNLFNRSDTSEMTQPCYNCDRHRNFTPPQALLYTSTIMTTLAEIQNVKAYHLPVPGAEPVVLSTGTLYLSVIPANPPSHPSQTIALSVGASSFPVLPNTPVQKIEAKEEHPRYAFSPLPADGGAAIGRVKIVLGPR
jgi:hypothetical protein